MTGGAQPEESGGSSQAAETHDDVDPMTGDDGDDR
jgi:hypothetical protein